MVLGLVSFIFIVYELTAKPMGETVQSLEFPHLFISLLASFLHRDRLLHHGPQPVPISALEANRAHGLCRLPPHPRPLHRTPGRDRETCQHPMGKALVVPKPCQTLSLHTTTRGYDLSRHSLPLRLLPQSPRQFSLLLLTPQDQGNGLHRSGRIVLVSLGHFPYNSPS